MNHNKTESILQRVPKILAVTAASYGLPANGRESERAGDARKGENRPQAAQTRRGQRH